MKKFSLAKILSLVVICVMLISALALTAFAAEDENNEVVIGVNLQYGESFKLMYAIGNAPEGATVKATDSKGNEIKLNALEDVNIEDVIYDQYILSVGVSVHAIDEVITLTVADSNGETVAVKNYSVLQYVYERMYVKNIATGDELAMLKSLLDFSAKADLYFNGTSADATFDKYQYITVTGATVNGIDPTGMYAPNSTPFANLDAIEYDATKYELTITVNEEVKTLDELKALTVADTAITVTVEIAEKETHTHDYVDGVCTGCGEQDPDYYFEMSIADALTAEAGAKVIVSGTVCEIYQAWNESYGNISVYITDGENKLLCYRMDTNVVKGDIITVTGEVTEYNGANQLAQGCTADVTGHDSSYDVGAAEVTIGEALELADGTEIIVTGTVVKVNYAWSDSNGNMSVTIKDENSKELYIYRLATNVALNDVITVTGSMSTYSGARQIAAGATAEIVGTHECSKYTDATCQALAECVVCGTKIGELTAHDYVDGVCSVCGHEEGTAEITYATEEFAIAANAGTLSGKTISWASENFNFLGEQAGSTSAIRTSDSDHFRIYKSSKFTISGNNGQQITKIVIKCTSTSYAGVIVTSLSGVEGITAVADGTSVIITADTSVTEVSFTASAQTRVSNFEITYIAE